MERSESQDSIFGGHFVIRAIVGGEIDTFVDRKVHKKNSMGFEWHPVAVCGITPNKIGIVPQFFIYQLQI